MNDDILSNLENLDLDLDLKSLDTDLDLDLKLNDFDLSLPNLEVEELGIPQLVSTNELESIQINRENNSVNVKFKNIESFIDAHGSENNDLLTKSIKDLIHFYSNCSDNAKEIEEKTNFDLSVMDKLKPKDPLEAIMLKQILMTHTVINKFFIGTVLIEQSTTGKDLNIGRATKLIKSFNAQIQAYIKYTKGGHQKVTVQHVSVSEGSQAIIGNVSPSTVNKGGGVKI